MVIDNRQLISGLKNNLLVPLCLCEDAADAALKEVDTCSGFPFLDYLVECIAELSVEM